MSTPELGVPAALSAPLDEARLTAWANELFRGVTAPAAPHVSADASLGDLGALPFAPAGLGELAKVPFVPERSARGPADVDPLLASATPSSSLYFLDLVEAPPAIEVPSHLVGASPSIEVPRGFDPGGDRGLVAPTTRAPELPVTSRPFDVHTVRRDFPILGERVNGKPLVWLDNAATTQKPKAVIERLSYFYEHENSNIHRAAHTLAARSTDAYEGARESVRRFLGAPSASDVVFVRGATEAINLVAQTFGRSAIRSGDEIVISWLEHHSNIVPWQLLAAETGATLKVAPIDDDGQILLHELERLVTDRTKLVAVTQVSNALGTVTPIREIVAIAHRKGSRVLVDGAQAVSHLRVDVQALDVDFYVFSGHKVFAPTGIGVLYGKSELLGSLPPWQGGGNMIADVTFEKTVYNGAPARFEAGTGSIADAVGLGAALDYLERIGLENVTRYEHELLEYGTARLREIPRLRLVGTAKEKTSVLSFVVPGVPTEQIGAALAREGIAVRSGHHCAQPALRRFGLEATVRPSLAFYNTTDEIDALVSVVKRVEAGRLV